jgi:uncharacterized protein YndB with AHSA1/START domain
VTARVLVSTRVSATTERTFDAFVGDIGQWWRPSPLFPFTPGRSGRMVFDPGPEGRVVECYDDGTEFEIGRVQVWDPPSELVLTWRMSTFEPGQQTQLHVRFEPVDDATRVTVEHLGWDSIPQEHAARHGFPLHDFQQRLAEHWRRALESLAARLA